MSERAEQQKVPANAAAYFGGEVRALRDALAALSEEVSLTGFGRV